MRLRVGIAADPPDADIHVGRLLEVDAHFGALEGVRALGVLPDDLATQQIAPTFNVLTLDLFEFARAWTFGHCVAEEQQPLPSRTMGMTVHIDGGPVCATAVEYSSRTPSCT